jgi:hypothetical protein
MDISLFTPEYLETVFDYDPETGIVIWKSRPRTDFNLSSRWKAWNRKHAKQQAGVPEPTTCKLKVSMFGKSWNLDSLLWKMLTGQNCLRVGHKNGWTADNAFANLTDKPCRKPTKYKGRGIILAKDDIGRYCILSTIDKHQIHCFFITDNYKTAKTHMLELAETLQTEWENLCHT